MSKLMFVSSSERLIHGRLMYRIFMYGIFKRPFLWPELYRSPGRVSIPVLLDEKSTVVPVRVAGEQSGGKRKVSYGDARSNSERPAPSACVGRAAFGFSDRLE